MIDLANPLSERKERGGKALIFDKVCLVETLLSSLVCWERDARWMVKDLVAVKPPPREGQTTW